MAVKRLLQKLDTRVSSWQWIGEQICFFTMILYVCVSKVLTTETESETERLILIIILEFRKLRYILFYIIIIDLYITLGQIDPKTKTILEGR